MKANMGKTDKLVRLILAVIILLLTYTKVITGTGEIVALIIAIILLLTSLFNFCPLYKMININTNKKD